MIDLSNVPKEQEVEEAEEPENEHHEMVLRMFRENLRDRELVGHPLVCEAPKDMNKLEDQDVDEEGRPEEKCYEPASIVLAWLENHDDPGRPVILCAPHLDALNVLANLTEDDNLLPYCFYGWLDENSVLTDKVARDIG